MRVYILCVYEPKEKGVRTTPELLTVVPRGWDHSRGGRPALPFERRWSQEGQRDVWPRPFPALRPSPQCPDETCPLPTEAPEVSALPWARAREGESRRSPVLAQTEGLGRLGGRF